MAKIIIKTNENNPLAFKLLIASYFGKKDVEIRNIKASGVFDIIYTIRYKM